MNRDGILTSKKKRIGYTKLKKNALTDNLGYEKFSNHINNAKINKATEDLTQKELFDFIKDSVAKWGKGIEEAKDNDIVAYLMGIPFTKKELIEAWKDQNDYLKESKEGRSNC